MTPIADKLKGNWNSIKGKLKSHYAELTDDDLMYEEGKEAQLLGAIQKKTGESKERINEFLENLKF